MIYCGMKSELEKFKRVYLPRDIIIEFPDDGSDQKVRLKTGRMDYSAPYPQLPYVACDGGGDSNSSGNRYVFNMSTPSDKWIIHHNLKCYPLIQLYDDKDLSETHYTDPDENGNSYPITTHYYSDHHIMGKIHYVSIDVVEITFSEPVTGYAICLGIKEKGMIYRGNNSTVWEIQHNLGAKPFTQVFDNGGYLINAEIEHIDDDNTKISFFSGRDFEVVDDESALYGYRVDLGDKTPYKVSGFAVLITEPSASYIHEQTEPSMEWEVRHNLNNYCIIQVMDDDLVVLVTEIRQVNKSVAKITFSEPVTGKAVCVSYKQTSSSSTNANAASAAGGVIVVPQYELPDVAEAITNTIYVIKETGFAYVTNDNFQWITITPGPTRVDGNLYKDEEGMEIDGDKWDNHTWENNKS